MSAKRLIAIPLAALLENRGRLADHAGCRRDERLLLLETVASRPAHPGSPHTGRALSQARDSIEASLGLGFDQRNFRARKPDRNHARQRTRLAWLSMFSIVKASSALTATEAAFEKRPGRLA